MTSAVESELQEITKTKPKKGEDHQDYLDRIVDKVQDLSDKAWHTLSNDAQDWFNAAARAIQSGSSIVDFEDESKGLSKPNPRPVVSKVAKPPKTISSRSALKLLLIDNPSLTVTELHEMLKQRGHMLSPLTIGTARSETRHTMKLLKEAGLLKIEL